MKKFFIFIVLTLMSTQVNAQIGFVFLEDVSLVADSSQTVGVVNVIDTATFDVEIKNLQFATGDTNIVFFVNVDSSGTHGGVNPAVVVEYAPLLVYPDGNSPKVSLFLNDAQRHLYTYVTLGDTIKVGTSPTKISIFIPLIKDIRVRVRRTAAAVSDTAGMEMNTVTTVRILGIGKLEYNFLYR